MTLVAVAQKTIAHIQPLSSVITRHSLSDKAQTLAKRLLVVKRATCLYLHQRQGTARLGQHSDLGGRSPIDVYWTANYEEQPIWQIRFVA